MLYNKWVSDKNLLELLYKIIKRSIIFIMYYLIQNDSIYYSYQWFDNVSNSVTISLFLYSDKNLLELLYKIIKRSMIVFIVYYFILLNNSIIHTADLITFLILLRSLYFYIPLYFLLSKKKSFNRTFKERLQYKNIEIDYSLCFSQFLEFLMQQIVFRNYYSNDRFK